MNDADGDVVSCDDNEDAAGDADSCVDDGGQQYHAWW